jgi:hypothetical protein
MSPDRKKFQMDGKISGLSLDCGLEWYYHIPLWGSDAGGITASAKNGDVDISVAFLSDDFLNQPVNSYDNTGCKSSISLEDIKVEANSISGKTLIPFLIDLVKGKITDTLNTEICSYAQAALNTELKNTTSAYHSWASPFMSKPPPVDVVALERAVVTHVPPGDELVNFRTMDLLQSLRKQYFIPLEESNPLDPQSPLGQLNGFINKTLGPNGIHVPLNYTLVDIKDSYIAAKVVVAGVNLSGLNSFRKLVVLKMAEGSNYTMNFEMAMEAVDFEAVFNITLVTEKASSKSESFSAVQIKGGVRNIVLGFEVLGGFNRNTILNCRGENGTEPFFSVQFCHLIIYNSFFSDIHQHSWKLGG